MRLASIAMISVMATAIACQTLHGGETLPSRSQAERIVSAFDSASYARNLDHLRQQFLPTAYVTYFHRNHRVAEKYRASEWIQALPIVENAPGYLFLRGALSFKEVPEDGLLMVKSTVHESFVGPEQRHEFQWDETLALIRYEGETKIAALGRRILDRDEVP